MSNPKKEHPIKQLNEDALIFRRINSLDLQAVFSVFSNKETMNYTMLDPFETIEDFVPFFEKIWTENEKEKPQWISFLVYQQEAPLVPIGIADLEVYWFPNQQNHTEIGYFLLPEMWGKGYASLIAKKLIAFCFTELKSNKVAASCHSGNKASENVMIKNGMKKEGVIRAQRWKHGKWCDELRYGILAAEYRGRVET